MIHMCSHFFFLCLICLLWSKYNTFKLLWKHHILFYVTVTFSEKIIFCWFIMSFIVFNHANACASMGLPVEIYNSCIHISHPNSVRFQMSTTRVKTMKPEKPFHNLGWKWSCLPQEQTPNRAFPRNDARLKQRLETTWWNEYNEKCSCGNPKGVWWKRLQTSFQDLT